MSTVEPPPLPNSLSQLHHLLFFLFLLLFFIYGPLNPINIAQMHMRTSDHSVLNPKWEMSVTAPLPRVRKYQGNEDRKTIRARACHVFWTWQGLLYSRIHSNRGCRHNTLPDNIPAWRVEELTRPHQKHHY